MAVGPVCITPRGTLICSGYFAEKGIRTDYIVLGNHVNLASRLADQARVGQGLGTDATMAAVDHFVDGKLVDEISLKGVSRPIKIYEIVPRAT